MALVLLPALLRDLAGGRAEIEVDGPDVGAVLSQLEEQHPALRGWITDEQGAIRRHVNVFVNGERVSVADPLDSRDRIHVLPAISGGAVDAELLVGTRKGLFVLRGPAGGSMSVAARHFPGEVVEFAIRDLRTGTYHAAVTHGHYGPHVFFTDDPEGEWAQSDGPAFPEDTGATVDRIWVVRPGQEDGVLWAGVAPAALFKSTDGGRTWSLNRSLWDVPGRPEWQGGAGGLCLHSICPHPGDPGRMAVGISAAGVWLTEDGGDTWSRGVEGLVPPYLPEDARDADVPLCVHNMHRSADPDILYMQFHGGVYRSDDGGRNWSDIGGGGLPSNFGFPLIADPNDSTRAFVIPLSGDYDRVTPDGAVRVFETRDSGESWNPMGKGLPESDAYHTVLRQAFGHDDGDPLGLYFGSEQGVVFGSADGGETWATVAENLPPVVSVRCS